MKKLKHILGDDVYYQAIIFTRSIHRQFQFDHSGFEYQKAFQPKLLIVLFYVLFVCKCVLYCCHRVSTRFQLTNISYTLGTRAVYQVYFSKSLNKSVCLCVCVCVCVRAHTCFQMTERYVPMHAYTHRIKTPF